MSEQVIVREDCRRDGLAATFILDGKAISHIAQAFPGSKINIGYPIICEKEYKACEEMREQISASYDFMLGFLLYDRAIQTLKESGINTKEVAIRIKDVFNKELGDYKEFFSPVKHFYRGFHEKKRVVLLNEDTKYR